MSGTLDAAWSSRLTGAIVQLQTSIQAYKASHETSPHSKPSDPRKALVPVPDGENCSNIFFEQAPTTNITRSDLDILEAQLSSFEQELKQRGQWSIPPQFQPDPSLSIDLSDLDNAMSHLQNAIDMPRYLRRAQTSYAAFAAQKWEWDSQWAEWYYEDPRSGNHVYLTEWRLSGGGGEWEMVWRGHRSADQALAVLGSWEDWEWDEEWDEWYLPLDVANGTALKRRIYASEWKRTKEGNWVHVDQSAAGPDEEEIP